MGQAAGRTRHRPLRALAAWRLTSWIARARLARLTRRQGRPPPASTSSDRSGRTRAAAAAGCGEPSCPSSEPWYANSTSWRPASHWSRHRAPAHRPGRQAGSPPRRPPASGDPARRPGCNWSKEQDINSPDEAVAAVGGRRASRCRQQPFLFACGTGVEDGSGAVTPLTRRRASVGRVQGAEQGFPRTSGPRAPIC